MSAKPNENWMADLPLPAQKVSIIYLAIPGSHNSMTCDINRHSQISPDADRITRKINRIFPRIVRRWAKTQSTDAKTQLRLGIRYFDLRVCLKDKTNFYFAHGCYSTEVFKVLEDINEFLNEHPKEFVILDFQHFYGLSPDHHEYFQNRIKSIFDNKLYGRLDGSIIQCSLRNAWKHNKQVFVVYRYSYYVPQIFWTSEYWPTPWPNTCNIRALEIFLEKSLSYRPPNIGYVSQCIITPNPRYILLRFPFSLKFCVRKVNKVMNKWIKNQRPGVFHTGDKPYANVFILDFIEFDYGEFCKNVIQLNNLIT